MPIDGNVAFWAGEADNPIRIPRYERLLVPFAGRVSADRMGMKHANDMSLVFLRFVADCDPFGRVENEGVLGIRSRVADQCESVGDQHAGGPITVNDAASFIRKSAAASIDYIIPQLMV